MFLEPLGDGCRAAYRGYAFVCGQNDPEFDAFRKAPPDHDPIAMLKDVEGESRARKENNIERKKWYANRFHALRSVDSRQRGLLLPADALVSASTRERPAFRPAHASRPHSEPPEFPRTEVCGPALFFRFARDAGQTGNTRRR